MPPLDDTGSVPAFDPTKPFDVEGGEKGQKVAPAFDPKQPFSVEEPAKGFIGSTIEAGRAGISAGTEALSQTGAALKGKTVEPSAPSTLPAAQPVTWSDFKDPALLAEKSVYQFGQSWPTLVYGIGGGMAGTAIAGPIGAIAGGALGAGLASTVQAIGPQFAAALKENPSDPDAAFSAAMKHAAVSGIAGAAGWGLFGWKPFESTIKNILFQTFGVQQAVGAAERGTENVLEGKPVGEGIAEGIPGTAVSTAIPLVGHAAVEHGAPYLLGRQAQQPPGGGAAAAPAPVPPAVGSTSTITTPRGPVPVTVTGVTPGGIVEVAHSDGTRDAMPIDEFNRLRVEPPAAQPSVAGTATSGSQQAPFQSYVQTVGPPRTVEEVDRQARAAEQAQAGLPATPEATQPTPPPAAIPEPLPPSAEDIRAEQERQKLTAMAQPPAEPTPSQPAPNAEAVRLAAVLQAEQQKLPPGFKILPPDDTTSEFSLVSPQGEVIAEAGDPEGLSDFLGPQDYGPPGHVAPQPEAQTKAGEIKAAFDTMGGGAPTAQLYEGLFGALQSGSDTFAGIRDPVIAKAKPFFDQGLIKSPDDLHSLVQAGYDPQLAGLVPPTPQPAAPDRGEHPGEGVPQEAPVAQPVPTVAPAEPPQPEANPQINLAAAVERRLADPKPITAPELQRFAEEAYGSKLSEGKFTRAEMYDALELGVNRYVAAHPELFDPHADLATAKVVVGELEKIKDQLPTQTVRAGEKDRFQQFSTPPDYSYAAAWLADLRNDDRVLEPSAGTGSLVAHASNSRASQIITNELSENRAPLVESLAKGQDRSFREDAEQLNNILPPDVRPSVVLMNPPFSQTAGRLGDKKVLMTGARHIDQALARLEPGGRLVAIVGRGMTMDAPTFKRWWAEKASNFDVRANMGIPGKVYGKYGTNFATRLLVIDKVPPSGRPVVTGNAESLPDAMERLDAVRQDRPSGPAPEAQAEQPGIAGQPVAGQPTGPEVAPPGPGAAGPELPVPSPTPQAGVRPGSAAPGAGGQLPGGVEPSGGRPPGPEAEPGAGHGVASEQPQQGRPEGADLGAQQPPAESPELGGGEPEDNGVGVRPEGEPGPVLPTGGESPGVDPASPPPPSPEPPGAGPSGVRDGPAPETVSVDEAVAGTEDSAGVTENVYEPYKPQRITIRGAQPHPGNLVQSAAMASVLPPKVDYAPRIPQALIKAGELSDAQLEAITYAGQAHSQTLPANEGEVEYRRGYFIGDGCVAAGTRILNPLTGEQKPIETLVGKPYTVLSLTQNGFKAHSAAEIFLKGEADLFRVRLSGGQEITVTSHHRFLTPDGWKRLWHISLGNLVASASVRSGTSFPIRGADEQHCFQRPQDCLGHCSSGRHPCDARLRVEEDSALTPAPLRDDVPARSHPWSHRDAQESAQKYIHHGRSADRRSKNNFSPWGSRGHVRSVSQAASSTFQSLAETRQGGKQSLSSIAVLQLVPQEFDGQSASLCCDYDLRLPQLSSATQHRVAKDKLSLLGRSHHTVLPSPRSRRQANKKSLCQWRQRQEWTCAASSSEYDSRWGRVMSIDFVRRDKFYDMYVPGPENYVAEGFINHNTGVGKGREVAGIILDNWQQGRQKALWVSENKDLIKDAQRDWSGLGQDPKHVFDLGKTGAAGEIKNPNGIAFATYDTLATGGDKRTSTSAFLKGQEVRTREGDQGVITKTKPVRVSKGTPFYEVKMADGSTKVMPFGDLERAGPEPEIAQSRVDQMVNWLGKDFDGVIAFDESHNMGNSLQEKGSRGVKEAAQKAIAAIELQDKLPNARVVYVSATGATEVKNLAYAQRLGLWGRGTAFANKLDFISKIGSGGIAAMELVARDMKAMGHYISRNLSYDDVKYDRVEHNLTPEQKEIYDQLAEGWQVVLQNINKALEITAPPSDDGVSRPSKRATAKANGAFWGGHQRFFNQVITSLQMPSVIRGIERDLSEGKQAVLQLVNTQAAPAERALAKLKAEEGDLEDLDITPKDQLLQMIDKSFPTQQWETFTDENGNERIRPVVDAAGNEVHNPEAVAMKEALMSRIASIRVPHGPLEMLLNHFGPEAVAEVTGRGTRVVNKPDENGVVRAQEETRGANANVSEANDFQNGKKKILVFSQAGMTGRSYHADRFSPSGNSQRSHYLVQAGWRADKAIQGFGRTHRTNQGSAPIFHLVTTDLQGQKRFISSIARRLAQLGALTKGERRAGESGMFGPRDNLESPEAHSALHMLWSDLQRNVIPGIEAPDFEQQTGLKLKNKDGEPNATPEITQFLNRLLSFRFDMQNHVFGEFERRLNDAIEMSADRGTLDVGTETLRGDKISKEDQRVVHTDPQSGAETNYVRLKVETRQHPIPFERVNSTAMGRRPDFYAVSKRSGKIYAVSESSNTTDATTGAVISNYRLRDPVTWSYTTSAKITGPGSDKYWELLDRDHSRAKTLWDKNVAETPEFGARNVHLITGAVLPIWDRLAGQPRVYRLQTDAGERMLGRVIDSENIDRTLRALGAEEAGTQYPPEVIAQRIMSGVRATLANGWTLHRSRVAGENRIELTGPNYTHEAELRASGVFTERIGYNQRYFIPTGDRAAATLASVLERRPITEMTGAREGSGEPGLAEGVPAGAPGAFRDTMAEFTHPEGAALDQHEAARNYVVEAGERTGNEHVAAYDAATGRIDHVGTGDADDNIGTFSPEFIKRLADPNAAVVLHHNHPNNGALSEADVSLLAAPGLHTITAHGHDGSFSAATLTPAAREFLDRHGFEDQIKILGDMRDVAAEKVASRLMTLGLRGQINERNANLIYADLSNRGLAAAGMIDYVSSRESPLDRLTTQGIIRQARDAVNMRLGRYRGQFAPEDSDAARFVRSADTVRPDEGLERVSEAAESDQRAEQPDLKTGNRPGRAGNEEALQRKGRVAEDEERRGLLADERGGVSIKAQTEAVKAAAKGVEKILSPTTVDKTSQLAEALHRKETGMARGEIERANVRVDPFRAAERKYLKEYQDYIDQPRGPGITPKGDPALLKVNDFMESRSTNPVYQGPPELKPLADMLRKIYTEGRTAIEHEPTMNRASFIDDYVSHDYVKKGSGGAWGRIKQGGSGFLKERRIPTIREALEEGLTPVDPSLIGTAMKYVDNLYKYRAANRIFAAGLDSKMIQRFAPGKAPEGWTKLDGRLSENIETYGTSPSGGKFKLDRPYITHAYAPDGFARIYNNNVDPGWHSTPMGASVYNAILRSVNAVTSAKLAFPGYHALAMANEGINSGMAKAFGDISAGDKQAALKAMGHSVLIAPELKGIYSRGDRLQQQYLRTANFGPDYAKAAELLEKGGGRPIGRGAEYRGSSMENYFQAFKRGTLKSELGETARDLAKSPVRGLFREYGRIMDTVSAPLFDQVIPKLKTGAYFDEMSAWLKNNPTATPEEQLSMSRQMIDSMDDRFGEMIMDNIFWNKRLKQSLQLLATSVGWELGSARALGGGAKDLLSGKWSPRARWLVAFPIVMALSSAVYQYLKTGQGPDELKDIPAPKTGGQTPEGTKEHPIPERGILPGYTKDVLGVWKDVGASLTKGDLMGAVRGVGQLVGSKQNPAIRLGSEIITGKDWKGQPIALSTDSFWDSFAKYAQHIAEGFAPIPFTQTTYTGSNISPAERLAGIRSAPSYLEDPERSDKLSRVHDLGEDLRTLSSQIRDLERQGRYDETAPLKKKRREAVIQRTQLIHQLPKPQAQHAQP